LFVSVTILAKTLYSTNETKKVFENYQDHWEITLPKGSTLKFNNSPHGVLGVHSGKRYSVFELSNAPNENLSNKFNGFNNTITHATEPKIQKIREMFPFQTPKMDFMMLFDQTILNSSLKIPNSKRIDWLYTFEFDANFEYGLHSTTIKGRVAELYIVYFPRGHNLILLENFIPKR
jgi:hypothetical protein